MARSFALLALVLGLSCQVAHATRLGSMLRGLTARRNLRQDLWTAFPQEFRALDGKHTDCVVNTPFGSATLNVTFFDGVTKRPLGDPEPAGELASYAGYAGNGNVYFYGVFCDIFQTQRTQVVLNVACGTTEAVTCSCASMCSYSIQYISPAVCSNA